MIARAHCMSLGAVLWPCSLGAFKLEFRFKVLYWGL